MTIKIKEPTLEKVGKIKVKGKKAEQITKIEILQIKDLASFQDLPQIIVLLIVEIYLLTDLENPLETDLVQVGIHQEVINLTDHILEIENKIRAALGEAKADLMIELDLSQAPMGEDLDLCLLTEVTQMKKMRSVKFVAVGTLQLNALFILMGFIHLVELVKDFTDRMHVLMEA